MKRVPLNKIIPFSVVDGIGNRTSIFLQGCNIHCGYCHNPETQKLCRDCGQCVEGCPAQALYMEEGRVRWDAGKCIHCDRCIAVCPYFASPKIRYMDAQEVFEEVVKGIPFIRGITVSGGECMLYPEFLTELFGMAKEKSLTCFADSNGTVDFSKYPDLLASCDGVMLDVKSWQEDVYQALTGGTNEIVKKNLRLLAELGKLEEIRIVCLPGQVDAKEAIEGIKKTIPEYIENVKLKLIMFRNFGVQGTFAEFSSPTREYMEGLKKSALAAGFQKITIT